MSEINVPSRLLETFKHFRPDLRDSEFTIDTCCEILESLRGDGGSNFRESVNDKARIKLLQEELRIAYSAGTDIEALKAKSTHIMGQFTREIERANKAEYAKEHALKRMNMLTCHIEKLMKCLHLEATSKVKCIEAHRRDRRLIAEIMGKMERKDRMIGTQKRLISELREGAYVLEGQLRLMDERFYELRNKLDTARKYQNNFSQKTMKEMQTLRKKYTLIMGPRHSLDDVELPAAERDGVLKSPATKENASPNFGIITEFDGTDTAQGGTYEGGNFGTSTLKAEPGRIRPSTSKARTDPQAMLQANLKMKKEKKQLKRAGTAPSRRPKTAGNTKNNEISYGFKPSGDEDADVDKIITRIYHKQRENSGSRWTPAALTELVKDDSGKVHCPIPDLVDHTVVTTGEAYERQRWETLNSAG